MPVRYHLHTMVSSPQITEWSRFYRYDETGEIAALHARFVSRRYPPHSHDYFVIGLVESGAQSYTYKGARHITPTGQVFVVNPDEIHTGEAASERGYLYRTLCLNVNFVARLTRELGGTARSLFLKGAVLREADLATALRRFHLSLSNRHPRIESDTLLCEAVSLLFSRHGNTTHWPPSARCEPEAVRKAREYIEANFVENLSLARLATVCTLSPFSLAKAFKLGTGLPPHAYLDGVRLRRARQLLDRGEPIVSVAVSVGYADQSHLTKRFKRLYGITPGQYSGRMDGPAVTRRILGAHGKGRTRPSQAMTGVVV
jgi:AraC-like DNA-binding protein